LIIRKSLTFRPSGGIVAAATTSRAADVLVKLAPEVAKYFNENSVHHEIGGKLLAAWQTGIRDSLGFPKMALV